MYHHRTHTVLMTDATHGLLKTNDDTTRMVRRSADPDTTQYHPTTRKWKCKPGNPVKRQKSSENPGNCEYQKTEHFLLHQNNI